jgi:prepilin-type N-terminal cleavage/methylation domain-containing protein
MCDLGGLKTDKGMYRKGRKIRENQGGVCAKQPQRRQVRTAKMKSIKHKKTGLSMTFAGARRNGVEGFTLAEVILVVVILAIAALMALPFAVSGSSMQLRSAANVIAADLEYAKSMAISRGTMYSVVFDPASESYQIEDSNGVIGHPVKKGFPYIVNFATDSRLSRVDISSVDFDSGTSAGDTVRFDYLGSPFNASNNPLNSGAVNLNAGGSTMTVNVEPVTGYITITQ